MKRPCIGVTGPDRGGAAAWLATRLAVRRAGGRARRITPSRPAAIEHLDGLILGGGADVDPGRYERSAEGVTTAVAAASREVGRGRASRLTLVLTPLTLLLRRWLSVPREEGHDQARDALELDLARSAHHRDLPVLGICRGAQVMNVCLGGTLKDLDGLRFERPRVRTVLPRQPITLAPDSRLAAVLGTTQCVVNSLHHQAVDDSGDGLRPVAWDENQVIQAVERIRHPFWIGVQWHPEYLPQERVQQRLFARLVALARDR